jgi:hypothetical protein
MARATQPVAAAARASADPESPEESTAPAATADAAEDAPELEPTLRFELGLAKLDAGALHIKDNFTPQPVEVALSELALELRDLALGGDPARAEPDRATLSARFAAEGIAKALELDATLTSKPGPLDVEVELSIEGTGLETREIDPWLTELGVESTLVDGRLQLALRAAAASTAEGTEVAASLSDMAFRDGERELLALAALEVDKVVLGDGFTRVGPSRSARRGSRRRATPTGRCACSGSASRPRLLPRRPFRERFREKRRVRRCAVSRRSRP